MDYLVHVLCTKMKYAYLFLQFFTSVQKLYIFYCRKQSISLSCTVIDGKSTGTRTHFTTLVLTKEILSIKIKKR